ncbi:hypothetical protein [Oleiagrimonas sp. MCCC 1A03011]|uniref:hypothetical protein n=1 Tax=Oleiagrimonas sp. MCCC 1A03011 TaxID=1926883 RepID=UPI000DC3FB1C|nr:hypothetical protein [Oleiagrimonas sp. MCCC 1A03011]RAP59556.1 hypothetical protein BTJ49_02580 [Oleiagrimonas sp. MCCC 1A03011]
MFMHILLLGGMLAASGTPSRTFPEHAAFEALEHATFAGGYAYTCLRVDDRDPSPALLKRVQRNVPGTVPASACTAASVPVTYRLTGERAVLISTFHFHRTEADRAEANLDIHAGPMAGNGYTVYFRLVAGRWQWVGTKMRWAS